MPRLFHWNNGSPTPVSMRGSGSRCLYVNASGDIVMGDIKADSTKDLYELQIVTTLSEFEVSSGTFFQRVGSIIKQSYQKSYKPIADLRLILADKAKAVARIKLAKTDWLVVRGVEDNTKPIPNAVKQYRAAVRTSTDSFESALAAETDPATLITMTPTWPEE